MSSDVTSMTKTINPFFSFYGGKWRAAPKYPKPQYKTIIEPFAGSAGYSLRYHDYKVILVEKDPVIAAVWRYLINVSEQELLSLPDIEVGQDVKSLPVSEEAQYLIGFWLHRGGPSPGRKLSAWGRDPKYSGYFWGSVIKERIASQLSCIRHWKIIEADYSKSPSLKATWFIDPPYEKYGKTYRYGPKQLNYKALANWCKSLSGQVTVCENVGAIWLPFKHWIDLQSNAANNGKTKVSKEAIWTND